MWKHNIIQPLVIHCVVGKVIGWVGRPIVHSFLSSYSNCIQISGLDGGGILKHKWGAQAHSVHDDYVG